jgi:integrase
MYFGTDKFPTRVAIERHLETFVLKLNVENPLQALSEPTFNALLDRFIAEEKLFEIKQCRPGERLDGEGDLSYSTALSYLSVIKRIRARWGTTEIDRMKPFQIQEWLKAMDSAPKTKGHVKAIMHRLFEKAMLWEMVELQRNPMQLVEIEGISKRRKKPIVLSLEQYDQLLRLVPQPYRTMVVVAQCTGLRAEEVLALEWRDIDFENLSMRVVRAVVHGRVKTVKTEYSEDELPLDPDFAAILLDWKRQSNGSELVFPSHITGRHFHTAPVQQDYIRPAGRCRSRARNAQPLRASGAEINWAFRSRPTRNGELRPESTTESGGIRSGTLTARGSTIAVHRWGCSKS